MVRKRLSRARIRFRLGRRKFLDWLLDVTRSGYVIIAEQLDEDHYSMVAMRPIGRELDFSAEPSSPNEFTLALCVNASGLEAICYEFDEFDAPWPADRGEIRPNLSKPVCVGIYEIWFITGIRDRLRAKRLYSELVEQSDLKSVEA